jgi:probable rRNA maturation factor
MDKKLFAEPPEIEVQIVPAFAGLLSADHFQAIVETTLRHEGKSGSMTVVITDDKSIQDLNRDFLGRDAPTDVLAFSAQEESGSFVVAPEAGTYLGDVIVSYPRASEQAEHLGHPVEEEMDLLVVHGILHLLGYDHATADEKAVMWSRQDAILKELRSG